MSPTTLGSPKKWLIDDPWTVRLLTTTTTALGHEGLLDRDRTVEMFQHRTTVPAYVLRQLPLAAREVTHASQVAAAWLWLTLTGAGELRSRHRALHGAEELIRSFHNALTAEGRLVLVEYGLNELGDWTRSIEPAAIADDRLSNGVNRDAG